MKHNNAIHSNHFRKDWQRFVKLWLNQPSKKLARRQARQAKAKAIAPRPLDKLRPVVRGQTQKYNMKVRAGRGFTYDELKGAGIKRKEAQGVGIAIDHRRENKTEETYQANVARLKLYKSKLVVFPRNATSKRAKKGDATKDELKKATQVSVANLFPIAQPVVRAKARKITEAERNANVARVIRTARLDEKLWGRREKRAKDKAEGKKKEKKDKDGEMDE
jgi:large subunit ribosomal protein L13e